MIKKTIVATACACLTVISLNTSAIVINYSGTFVADYQGDALGLDGASFQWEGTFDEALTPSYTNGSNLDRFSGDITLTLSGTANLDGTYAPTQGTIGEVDGGTGYDQMQLSNAASFNIDGLNWNVGTLLFASGFLGDVGSAVNTLTSIDTSDVVIATGWFMSDFNTYDDYYYEIADVDISSVTAAVPEPTVALLLASGLIVLGVARRTSRV